jgi:hypothetical protein
MREHETYLVRLWLPDRPGALGAVASRFGALKGDVVGLEIIERGGGLAIDELVVTLPANVPLDLVAREIGAEDEVEVEDIRPLGRDQYDPQLDLLETASIVLGADDRDDLAKALVDNVCRAVRAEWACVVERSGGVISTWGDRPNDRWIDSFISGSPALNADGCEVADRHAEMDTVWIPLPAADASLVVGRDTTIRARERQRLAALARIADAWFRRLKERSDDRAWALHPSRGAETP